MRCSPKKTIYYSQSQHSPAACNSLSRLEAPKAFLFLVCLFVCLFLRQFLYVAQAVLELNSVEQGELELRDLPVFASEVLRLKVCATMPSSNLFLKKYIYLFNIYNYSTCM